MEISVIGLESRVMVLLQRYEERERRINVNKLLSFLEYMKMRKLADEIRGILKENWNENKENFIEKLRVNFSSHQSLKRELEDEWPRSKVIRKKERENEDENRKKSNWIPYKLHKHFVNVKSSLWGEGQCQSLSISISFYTVCVCVCS